MAWIADETRWHESCESPPCTISIARFRTNMTKIPTAQLSLRLLSLLLASAWLTACSCGETTRCDEDGCYVCDGVDCRPVDPPGREICQGDFACTDSVCTSIGCVEQCEVTGDCGEGTICRGGFCVHPDEADPTRTPGDCVRSADCGASGLICIDGLCAVDPDSCTRDADCNGGERCLDGRCRSTDDLCQFNYECEDGTCVNGQCLASCGGDASCPLGQSCNEALGRCEPLDPPTGQCEADADCGEGGRCIDSACYDACTTDETCGEGRYCLDNICVPDTRPRPFCINDTECNGGPCVGGVCRTTCENATECRRFDNQFTECESNYCVTNSEFTSDCQISADCGDESKVCIDGICRNG